MEAETNNEIAWETEKQKTKVAKAKKRVRLWL